MPSAHSALGRAVQKVAGSPAFAKVGPKVVPPMDKALHRLTGGRVLLSRALLPSLLLTTTGRRSGQPRETPLMCVPEEGGSFLVLGSNFGRDSHPAWTGNLLATPEASVSYGARDIPVRAVLLEGAARDAAWDSALRVWPTFAAYQSRIDRTIRVFRLNPTEHE
jgi:deazaflavin-dependent oxidoreductase (nitroreductase family)